MATDYKPLAEQIITLVGGKENIETAQNCVTRLRFVLKDESIAKTDEIKATKGVLGVAKQGGQYQVIIGTHVPKVMEAVSTIIGKAPGETVSDPATEKEDAKKDNLFNTFFKTISGCIFPVLGVLGAAGVLKGFLAILTTVGWLSTTNGTYLILHAVSDAALYFMPIILGFSCGKKFGCNPYITAVLGAALVYPDIVSVYTNKTAISFVGIPVIMASYTNSVFPIILSSYIASKIEVIAKKFIPQILQLMFVPFFVLVISAPLAFLAIGPVMTWVSSGLAAGTQAIYSFSPIIAGILLGAFWQVIVIFGLHYAFIPILINNITTMGQDPVNAILGVTVFALSGVALGYSIKVKDKEQKAFAISTMISGLVGVTEPIIYGIALPKKKPFVCAFVGGGIAGAITAAMGAAMQGFGGAGILAGPLMVKVGDSNNIIAWVIASVVAFVVSAVLCFITTKREDK